MKSEIVAFLIVALFLIPALPVLDHRASAQSQAQGFQIISAQWGTPTTNAEAGPGEQDVPLTLTIQYVYPYSALFAQLNVQLSKGFSPTSAQSGNNATIYYSNKLVQGQVFQVETFVNLARNVTVGKYSFPATILWSAILTNSTNEPEVSLEQNTNLIVSVQGASKLTFSSSGSGLIAGETNNVTLVLTNFGSGNVSNIVTTITSSNPQTSSVLNEIPETSELNANSSVSYPVELFVSSSASGSAVSLSLTTTYIDAYDNQQTTSQTLGLFVTSSTGTSRLVYRSLQSSLTPGQVNNITLSATNDGNEELSGISTQATSSSQSVSVLTQPQVIQDLLPGASSSFVIQLFVSGSASNTPLTLTISAGYTIAGPNNTGSVSQSLGLYVSSQQSASGNSSISVTTVSNNLETGQKSLVSFQIKNTGSVPIYYPTLSLSVVSPLVITANSSYTIARGQIPAQSNVIYEATILTSPSATTGVYDGTLTINYSNQYGIANSQTVQVGFVLTGTIELVIQDESITASSGNLTVSGTLLNEGTTIGYYASVSGSLNSSSRAGPLSYVGEIDPNTPVPFTATIPYTATSTSRQTVNLLITYKDNFGNNLNSTSSETTTIQPIQTAATSTGASTSTSGQGLVVAVFYAIIIVVIIAAVLGAVLVRRRRRATKVVTEDSKVV